MSSEAKRTTALAAASDTEHSTPPRLPVKRIPSPALSRKEPSCVTDTIRVTDHLAINLGVRWDLQTFTTAGLLSNPLFPPAGKVPFKPYNFGPRGGLAYSLGKTHPLVIR